MIILWVFQLKNRKDLETSHVTTGFNVSYRFLNAHALDE